MSGVRAMRRNVAAGCPLLKLPAQPAPTEVKATSEVTVKLINRSTLKVQTGEDLGDSVEPPVLSWRVVNGIVRLMDSEFDG